MLDSAAVESLESLAVRFGQVPPARVQHESIGRCCTHCRSTATTKANKSVVPLERTSCQNSLRSGETLSSQSQGEVSNADQRVEARVWFRGYRGKCRWFAHHRQTSTSKYVLAIALTCTEQLAAAIQNIAIAFAKIRRLPRRRSVSCRFCLELSFGAVPHERRTPRSRGSAP